MVSAGLIWTVALLVVLAIVLPYAWSFHRKQVRDRERYREARRLGIHRPRAQYPYIDPEKCIGCGACVEACPEGDVLGLVGGRAVVINGLRCVGHGRCQEACPVGAIQVGLGDVRSRDDIPYTDEAGETSVPGVYLAGEIRGFALIRNALREGERVVRTLHQRLDRYPAAFIDVVIVGAGPAGLAAALTARDLGLNYLVVEQEPDLGGSLLHYPRKKLVLTQPVPIPGTPRRLEREEYTKEELLAIFQEIVESYELSLRFGARFEGVQREDDGLHVRLEGGERLHTRTVVLAVGRRGTPRKLGVPGEDLPKVHYKLIDAQDYEGHRLLVVGGGDSAVEAAIGLAREGRNQVWLSYRREKIVRARRKNVERLEALIQKGWVQPLMPSTVSRIWLDRVELQTPSGTVEIPNDYVFVLIGGEPPFALLRACGIQFWADRQEAQEAFPIPQGSPV